jgi:hypothetical protein|nr:MAG TPA: tail assembly chaperone protein [Caudoviricetes sp.]
MDERTATVNIGGQEYEMLLTTRATKEIAGRYGGLENLGDQLMKSENFEMALDEIVWLITLLCNQPILVHNLKNPDDKKPELAAEEVELLTSPLELASYKDAIMEAMYKGTKRNIESEDTSKNVQVG